jgi:AcrR family transcriptional regulator
MVQVQTQVEDRAGEHRRRLLEGMAQAVASNGYSATTIADIVREASVSRRTFYEYFSTKAECLIALYEAASLAALHVLRDAIDPGQEWHAQAEKAMSAYLACLAQNPLLMRTLFIEILGLGMDGLAARRRVNQQIANFMLNVINADANAQRKAPLLTEEMAMAVVGGINELILQSIEQDRVNALQELAAPSIRLLHAAILSNPERGGASPEAARSQ